MAELLRPDRYPTHCSACRSGDVAVDAQAGDVVCRSCGTVLQDRLEVDDSCTRLENTGGDVTRHRSYHFTAEVEGDVDVEALDSERKRRRFEDQSQWGRNAGPSATLEQLRAAEARRRRRVCLEGGEERTARGVARGAQPAVGVVEAHRHARFEEASACTHVGGL